MLYLNWVVFEVSNGVYDRIIRAFSRSGIPSYNINVFGISGDNRVVHYFRENNKEWFLLQFEKVLDLKIERLVIRVRRNGKYSIYFDGNEIYRSLISIRLDFELRLKFSIKKSSGIIGINLGANGLISDSDGREFHSDELRFELAMVKLAELYIQNYFRIIMKYIDKKNGDQFFKRNIDFIRTINNSGKVRRISQYFPSLRFCSICGESNIRFLSDTEKYIKCDSCGSIWNKYINSAINIKNYGCGIARIKGSRNLIIKRN